MDFFKIILFLALLLSGMVAGMLFTFAVVVMPGIKNLNDHDYLQAFKAIDRVIQNGQPLFMTVWLGSLVVLVAAAILGFWQPDGFTRALLVVAAAIHLLGVQLPTGTVNVPLNNLLQRQELDSMAQTELHQLRSDFEPRWVRWNTIRTILAILAIAPLFVVIGRL